MEPKLNFFDRLLGRNTKTVVEKDKNGRVTEQVSYTYDRFGEVVSTSISRPDNSGALRKYKDKTFVRREDGSYDPEKTTYFDEQGRESMTNRYYRDGTGMLFGDQQKYSYSKKGAQLLTEASTRRYDGGLWTKVRAQKNQHDEHGHVIKREDFELDTRERELVKIKDKTYVRTPDGTYDPKETYYYDMKGRLVESKLYSREQTGIEEKPLLVGVDKKYSYTKDGIRKEESSEKSYHLGALWVPEESIKKTEELLKSKEAAKGTSFHAIQDRLNSAQNCSDR